MKSPTHKFRVVNNVNIATTHTSLAAAEKACLKLREMVKVQQWSSSCGGWQTPKQCEAIKICDECNQTYDDCDCREDDGTPIRHS